MQIKRTDTILFVVINNSLSITFLKIFIITGLLCLIMSSADTCLLTAGIILTYDIIKQTYKNNDFVKNNLVYLTKSSVLLLGFISIIIAGFSKKIISNLFLSYTIYTATIGAPAIMMLLFKNLKIKKVFIIVSIFASAIIVVYYKFILKSSVAGLIGLFTSFVIIIPGILLTRKWGKKTS